MSILFSAILLNLQQSDCIVTTQRTLSNTQQAMASLLHDNDDSNIDVSDDDDGEAADNNGSNDGGKEEQKKRSKKTKVKQKQSSPEYSIVGYFFILMEGLQPDVMQQLLHNDSYYELYWRLCHSPISATSMHHHWIHRCMYDCGVISALVHLYSGAYSLNNTLAPLPKWEEMCNRGGYVHASNKEPILKIIIYLMKHVNPEDGLDDSTMSSLQDNNFLTLLLREHSSYAALLMERCLIGNGVTSMTAMRLLFQECQHVRRMPTKENKKQHSSSLESTNTTGQEQNKKNIQSKTLKKEMMREEIRREEKNDGRSSFEILIDNLCCMLEITDNFTSIREKMLMEGESTNNKNDDIRGLIHVAELYVTNVKHGVNEHDNGSYQQKRITNYATKAYTIIKIIHELDTRVTSMHIWLEENREQWVYLVEWLDVASYEPSLEGNRYDLIRQRSAEETVNALAETGRVELHQPVRKEKGSPMIVGAQGNVSIGWQGITEVNGRDSGRVSGRHDNMKSTDVTTAILMTPVPEDGTLIEMQLFMGNLDYDRKRMDGYVIQIYEQVPNHMANNIKDGIDLFSIEEIEQSADVDEDAPGPPMFHIGERTTCSMPHPGNPGTVETGAKTGVVLKRLYDAQQGTYLYWLKYNEGSSDRVPEFLLSTPDAHNIDGSTFAHLRAFQLVSCSSIPKVRTTSAKSYGYSCLIPVKKGQYVGIHHTSGSLDLHYNGKWPKNEQNIFRYAYSRGVTPKCLTPGHVEYHCVHANESTWGFAATLRYDHVEAADPILHLRRPAVICLGGGGNSSGGSHGRHRSSGGSSSNTYLYEDDSSDSDENEEGDDDDGVYNGQGWNQEVDGWVDQQD